MEKKKKKERRERKREKEKSFLKILVSYTSREFIHQAEAKKAISTDRQIHPLRYLHSIYLYLCIIYYITRRHSRGVFLRIYRKSVRACDRQFFRFPFEARPRADFARLEKENKETIRLPNNCPYE